MAELCSLSTLLFWAGIIVSASCEETTTSSPPRTTTNATVVSPSVNSAATSATRAPPASTSNETSLTPTPPSSSSGSQASPTDTTVTAPTAATKTTPEPPKCSYTVTPIESGLQINLMNFTPGDYNVSIIEGGRRVINKTVINQSGQHNIQHLKPCTEYEHEVTFIHSDGNKTLQCTSTGNKTKTKEMSETDITVQSSINGCVCYQSNWDISSSISAPNVTSADQCSSDSKSFCVKHGDVCSDFETTFTSGNCPSLSITTNIIVDLYNSSESKLSGPTGLPAKIDPMSPTISECKNITVNYTCSEKDKPDEVNKLLSELEPFTEYSCTGLILNNNISTDKTTPPVHLNTDCVPDGPSKVTVTVPENNVIKVECHHVINIRGPDKHRRFIARLHPGGENKPQNKTDCKFEFKDLSYSTDYTVEVTVFNGYFESKPGRETAHTRYNDKAVTGFLIFLISAALLLVTCVCYRKLRKRRSDVDENVASEARINRKLKSFNFTLKFQVRRSSCVQQPCANHDFLHPTSRNVMLL